MRVSTEEQTLGYSLDAQVHRCREYCRAQGWEIVKEHLEPGVSARSADRPAFQKMLGDAKAGLFDRLVVLDWSRFSRDTLDTLHIINELGKLGVTVISLREPADYLTPDGKFRLTINAAVAELESANLGARVRIALEQRARSGLWMGNLSTGYCLGLCSRCHDDLCPDEKQENKGDGRVPLPHPVDSQGVKLLFELYATGQYTYDSMAAELTRQGYQMNTRWGRRVWTKDTIKKAIANRFYLGFVNYKGQALPGQHEAIISQELWDKCQAIRLRNRGKPRTYTRKFRTYLFRGILICEECGMAMTASTDKAGPCYHCASYYKRIDCSVSNRRVPEPMLEEQISGVITNLRLPPNWQERIEQLVNSDQSARDTEREQTRLKEKERRLRQAYFEVMIDEQAFRQGIAEVKEALAQLEPNSVVEIEIAVEHLKSLRTAWEGATKEEKSKIISTIFEAVYCDPATKSLVAVQPKRAFIPLLRGIGLLREDGTRFYIRR